jgi:hypothetical protein
VEALTTADLHGVVEVPPRRLIHNRVGKFIFKPVAQYWSETVAQFVREINSFTFSRGWAHLAKLLSAPPGVNIGWHSTATTIETKRRCILQRHPKIHRL